jgi:hypothetical protein
VATGGGHSFRPQHSGGRLLGGLQGTRPSVADLECIAVHGGAVGVLSLDKDKTDGGWCHRQAQYGVHFHRS